MMKSNAILAEFLAACVLGAAAVDARDPTRLPEVWATVRIPDRAAVISISRDGIVRVSSGEEMSLPISTPEELESFLGWLASERKGLPIILKVDKRTKYIHVDPVFSALVDNDVKGVYLMVIQATKPMDPELRRFFIDVGRD